MNEEVSDERYELFYYLLSLLWAMMHVSPAARTNSCLFFSGIIQERSPRSPIGRPNK